MLVTQPPEGDLSPTNGTFALVKSWCATQIVGNLRRLLVPGILLVHIVMLSFGAAIHSPTHDEPSHLAAGIHHWKTGDFTADIGNPPLFGMVAASPTIAAGLEGKWTGNPEWKRSIPLCEQLLMAVGARIVPMVFWGRLALIPVSVLGAYVCFRCAADSFGYHSGLVSLCLWCFNPELLSCAQQITGDVSAATLGIAAAYLYFRWLDRGGWWCAGFAGALLGISQLSKFVCVFLYPLFAAQWAFRVFAIRGHKDPSLALGSGCRNPASVGQLLLIIFLSIYVTNLGYGFEGSFRPVATYQFSGSRLSKLSDLLGKMSLADSIPVPFPAAYVRGIDAVSETADQPNRFTFLHGQWRELASWQFYLYALMMKVPLGTLLLLGVSTATSFTRGGRLCLHDFSHFAAPILVVFFFVSWATTEHLSFRYLLPALPFAVIWASRCAGDTLRPVLPLKLIAAVCVGWTVLSTLWTYPHCLSYFNELAGGPAHGHDRLLGSSIDSGQDVLFLRKWQSQHPDVGPLRVALSSRVDPRLLGIDVAASENGPDRWSTGAPLPGWFAISVDWLHERSGSFDYFLDDLKPVARCGYSIYIYHVTPHDANRIREKRRLPLIPSIGENPR